MGNNHEVDHEREDVITLVSLYKNIGLTVQEKTKQTIEFSVFLYWKGGVEPSLANVVKE
jgi:hypothetical protein